MDKDKLKGILLNDVDSRVAMKEKVNQYAYYVMIILVAILTVFVPPLLLGAVSGDLILNFPKTASGWIVWSIINLSTSVANVSILIFFKLQAKKNCLNHPNYLEACDILAKIANRNVQYIPRSPARMNSDDYIKKVVSIIVFTLSSFIAITSIVISFDINVLMSTLISMVVTIVISWSCMLANEEYWTNEYLMYAKYMQEKIAEQAKVRESLKEPENEESNIIEGENENVEIREQGIQEFTRTSTEECE